jgi:amino acid transporter
MPRSSSEAPGARRGRGIVSRTLARDRLGIPQVLFFVMAGIAPLTVTAGVIPTAFATTGLTAIPAAFLVIAVVLAVFASGYLAMARRIAHAGAFYACVTRGLGRPAGIAAALVALVAYSLLQVGLYGALGPAAAAEAATHLGVHWSWWEWALIAWALVTVLGQLRVDITGKVLGVLLTAEVIVVIAETIGGLLHPAAGRLSLSSLSPAGLTSGGFTTFGVLAVVAVLGFVGFEFGAGLSEEARHPSRTVPAATYLALGVIAVVYAGASWSMAAHAGTARIVAAAAARGPGLLYALSGAGWLGQAAQLLFLTSLFAAALAFHNVVWRYVFALGRENVLPAALGRTSGSNIPRAASLAQSATGLAVILAYALAGLPPMTDLFFWLGTTGGFGVIVLLALTSAAVIAFFARDPGGETLWRRLIAPALALAALITIAVLAVGHYAALLGVPPGSPAARILPACYAVAAAVGLAWALILRARRPHAYQAIGLGPQAAAQAARLPAPEAA